MPRHIPLALALVSGLAIAPPSATAAEPRPKCWIRIADSPYPTSEAAFAYDIDRDRAVLYGGENNPVSGVWEFSGSAWSNTSGSIGTRVDAEMAFDMVRRRVLLYGGVFVGSTATNTYEWSGQSWNIIATLGPEPRRRFSMVSDTLRRRLVLVGGVSQAGPNDNRTWEWDGASWTVASPIGPSARSDSGAAFDSGRGRTVLFGGQSPSFTFFSETWEWDGLAWALIPTPVSPSQVRRPAMAYSPKRARVLLHGGATAAGNVTGPETWSWDGTTWRLESDRGPRAFYAEIAYDASRARSVMIVIVPGSPNDNSTWALPDCPGDANADGVVNMTDLTAVLSNYGQPVLIGVPGDLDGDGCVGFADLNQVLSYFGSIGCD